MSVVVHSLSGASTLAIFGPLMAWSVYGRVKRNVGPQPLKERTLWIRIGILLAILIGFTRIDDLLLLSTAAGLALGAALAQFGLRLTRYEFTPGGNFYIPNAWVGMAVSLLFVARIGYRMFVIYGTDGGMAAAMTRTPLTMGLLALVIGYYLAYYGGVLRQAKRHPLLHQAQQT
ncbi:MAG TPA: hypothetical protein VHE37_01105 [Nevskiaceae bacterium]|nr:hypothetical protein [Nevskiaceae bacterium]